MSIEARFRLRRGDFTLSVELEAPARGVTAVFGPSGAGKTTLLRAMAGLERCDDGYLAVSGRVWQDESHFVPIHERELGYVFQEPSLFGHLSVRRNLEYGLNRVPPRERRVTFDQAVALLGVESLLDRSPDRLSGGERQRVAVARALLASPRLLLMDEPMASLDRRSKAEILPVIARLQAEMSIPVLYVSHSLSEVARIADHLAWMEKGTLRATGPIEELLTRVDLPLARGADAEALVRATVTGHDAENHLTLVDFAGGRFVLPGMEPVVGSGVRLRILARDVSLTLERQEGTSILNIFRARVESLAEEGPAQMMVRLDAGGVPILSRVTRRSVAALGLAPGREVWAQVKSVALLA